jgi:hypothetical protein
MANIQERRERAISRVTKAIQDAQEELQSRCFSAQFMAYEVEQVRNALELAEGYLYDLDWTIYHKGL